MKKGWIVMVGLCLGAFVLMASANPAEAQKKKFVSIATGGTGGTYYIIGAGLAKLINKYIPGVSATSEATAASVENTKLVGAGKATLALVMPDVGYYAYLGKREFKEKYDKIRGVAIGGHGMELHVMVREESPIKTIEDFRGKRIGVGAPGSGNEVCAKNSFEALGLTYKDFKPEWLSFTEVATGLKDGTIDIGTILVGSPGSAIMDITRTHNIRFLELEVDRVLKAHPYWYKSAIKKGTYKGVDRDISAVGVGTIIITHQDVDEDLIYKITKTVLEHTSELAEIHPAGKEYAVQFATRGIMIPIHPGSLRYLKEKGIPVK
jgi:hypothetical protein